eukprot:COSAG01_NODE_34290_length_550_cov_0.800443_2_plen_20_part_01
MHTVVVVPCNDQAADDGIFY